MCLPSGLGIGDWGLGKAGWGGMGDSCERYGRACRLWLYESRFPSPESRFTTIRGSQRTGKLTDAAMKQEWCASAWADSAFAGSLEGVIVTTGCSTTRVKCPPLPSVTRVPSAVSV